LVLVCLEFSVCSIWCEFRDEGVVVQGLGFCIVPFCAQHRWWTLQNVLFWECGICTNLCCVFEGPILQEWAKRPEKKVGWRL
jgi:hypothetical protein